MEKSATEPRPTAVLFVCHGNICRSPMAEFVMKHLAAAAGESGIRIESAAMHTDEIGSNIHRGTRAMLDSKGVPYEPRAAWLLTASKASEYDYLIGMDAYNIADLKRLVYPEDLPKVRLLLSYAGKERGIADPWYTHDFEATWNDVNEGCTALLNHIIAQRAKNE